MHTTQFPALVHCIFLAVTVFPSRQPAKHRPAWRILVPIFMIQRCLHFVDTFEALIYYIRWYKLKKGGPTLSVDSPNIDQHKKSALHFRSRSIVAPAHKPAAIFSDQSPRDEHERLREVRVRPGGNGATKKPQHSLRLFLVHHRGLEPRTH